MFIYYLSVNSQHWQCVIVTKKIVVVIAIVVCQVFSLVLKTLFSYIIIPILFINKG